MDKNILRQLQKISKERDWDIIEEIIGLTLNSRPVFQLRCSNIPQFAKTGYPHLYSVKENGAVFAIDWRTILSLSASYIDCGRNRIQ